MGTFLSTLVDSEDQIADDYNHIPSPKDVEKVRRHLMLWIPAELANEVIDDAQYWPKVIFTVTSRDDGHRYINQTHGPHCFLLTPKISDLIGSRRFFKIRKVGFRITSHDQGWGGENFPSKYEGSWTWFEAAIAREVEGGSRLEQSGSIALTEARIRQFMNERGDVTPDGVEVITVKTPRKSDTNVWHIQRNIRASSDDGTHEIIWSDEASDKSKEDEMKFTNMTGAGKGFGFVQSLEPDDRIVVFARALYPGWANYTSKIEVELYYSD